MAFECDADDDWKDEIPNMMDDQKSGIRLEKALRNSDGLEGLGMMQSHYRMKDDYSEMILFNEETVKLAQDGYDYIDMLLQNSDDKPKSRSTVQDFTFINKKKSRLEQRVNKLVRFTLQKLQNSSLHEDAIACAVESATRLVKNYKAGSDMYQYVDLSDQWGERGDVFACICAIAPDPDDISDSDDSNYIVDDIENEEDIFEIRSDDEIQEKDRDHYFFFGYYGEKWEGFGFTGLIGIEQKVHQWLLCKLWTTCNDKMKSIAMV